MARSSNSNKMFKNEYIHLKQIQETCNEKISRHVPLATDNFSIKNTENEVVQINIFKNRSNFTTLEKIIETYPDGIDPRDAAWMFNRILTSLMGPHYGCKIVHGAITPDHILLNLEDHNGILIDWCYSVKEGEQLKAISPKYKNYYPREVFDKLPCKLSLDIYMLALCMVKLMGGDIDTKENKESVPNPIKNLLKACLLGYNHRTGNVLDLYKDFNKILSDLYGPKQFRVFKLKN